VDVEVESPNFSSFNREKTSNPKNKKTNKSNAYNNDSSPLIPGYNHCQEPVPDVAFRGPQSGNDSWLADSSSLKVNVDGNASIFGGKCPSPDSSALGDAEDSDEKDESGWSEVTSREDKSSRSCSISELDTNLDWAEAVRLMGDNKWPNEEKTKQGSKQNADNNVACTDSCDENDLDVNDKLIPSNKPENT